MSVFLAYVHPGTVSGPFHESLVHVLTADKDRGRHIVAHAAMTSGPRIASARNQLVQMFLDHKDSPEWLWMVDTDMVFGIDQFEKLLLHADRKAVPVIGGLCFGGRAQVFPTLYRIVDPETNEGNAIQTVKVFPRNTLVKVDATGAAFLMIHRSVLEKMRDTYAGPHYWFAESVFMGHEFGEDWTFCLRAGQLGYPIHVHTGILIGHVKPRIIGLDDFERQQDEWLLA